MMRRRWIQDNLLLALVLMLALPLAVQSQSTVPYLWGRTWPGMTPVSIQDHLPQGAGAIALSPDRSEVLFHVDTRRGFRLRYSRWENGAWSEPVAPEFASDFEETYPAFSADGTQVVYGSMRARTPGGTGGNELNLWAVEHGSDGSWGTPYLIGNGVSVGTEHSPSLDADGNLYFARRGVGLMCAKADGNGGWERPRALPAQVNEGGGDHPFVTPDGNLLFFGSGRTAPWSGHNLWVAQKQADGSWSPAICLGDAFNSNGKSGWPHVSADGQILFFRGEDKVMYWVDMQAVSSTINTTQ